MDSNALPAFAQSFFANFTDSWRDDTVGEQIRFIVLDTETTGLDPRRDRLITIGAVAVQSNAIVLGDAFEVMLKVAYNNAAVTVHGITRHEAWDGLDEPEALIKFLDYLKDGVIVGHHIAHDIETLNCAYERHFGFNLPNRYLDTMDLTLHLHRAGAFADEREIHGFSLDALCDFFEVAPHDRHTAGGDAFITALIFLKLLRASCRSGRNSLALLTEKYLPEEEGDPH